MFVSLWTQRFMGLQLRASMPRVNLQRLDPGPLVFAAALYLQVSKLMALELNDEEAQLLESYKDGRAPRMVKNMELYIL